MGHSWLTSYHLDSGASSHLIMPGISGMQCTDAYSSCRNQLKHIQKIRYVGDEADQYERAWLLLADIYIQSGKFDLAQVWLLISNVYEGLYWG